MSGTDGATGRVRRGYLDGRWGQVHYRENGPAARTCLAFHESPLTGEVFEGLARAVEGRLHLVAVDTPGYGGSDGPSAMTTIAAYAEALWEATAPLREGPVWLLGSHTGALLAIEVARTHPEGVAGVALSGTPVFRPDRRWRYAGGHTPDLTPQRDGGHLQLAWERYQRKAAEGTSPSSLDFMTYAACTIAGNPRYELAYQAAFRYDTLEGFTGVRAPVVLLTARKDPCAEFDAELLELRPDAAARTIPDVSARPYWVAPDLFGAELLDLMDEAERA